MTASPIRLVALVSCFREGRLVRSAIESVAPHVDRVYVFDGPFGTVPEGGEESELDDLPENVTVARQATPVADDAAKRTAHVKWVRQHEHKHLRFWPLWALILDGDEILVNGEQLRIHAERARTQDRLISLRIAEWDGTVMRTFHRLLRADLVSRYELGAHRFYWSDVEGLQVHPNYVELSPDRGVAELVEASRQVLRLPWRWPLQGEPHILHRPYLRPDGRFDERASDAEAEWAAAEAVRLGIPDQ